MTRIFFVRRQIEGPINREGELVGSICQPLCLELALIPDSRKGRESSLGLVSGGSVFYGMQALDKWLNLIPQQMLTATVFFLGSNLCSQ